jgi:hypothetical protein
MVDRVRRGVEAQVGQRLVELGEGFYDLADDPFVDGRGRCRMAGPRRMRR